MDFIHQLLDPQQVPPTLAGLISALKSKFEIDETSEIQSVFRKSKGGAIVQFDDDMIRYYSHESMFIMQVQLLGLEVKADREE